MDTKRRVPGWRHWFSGNALIGGISTGYNVVLAIIGIAPITESALKWQLFAFGAVLSLAAWYSLARDNARSEEEKKESKRWRDESDAANSELRRLMEENARTNEEHSKSFAVVQIHLEKIRQDQAQIAAYVAQGFTYQSPQIQQLVESSNVSRATIEGIVKIPADSPFQISGTPQNSKADSFVQVSLPSVKSTGGHQS
jgi:hypothetical protein